MNYNSQDAYIKVRPHSPNGRKRCWMPHLTKQTVIALAPMGLGEVPYCFAHLIQCPILLLTPAFRLGLIR
ncbi:hypothetical protein LX69_02837 [Breznakibacter xylanolyticus]|uniref:Uncharacterized protein n=1 Tax=Breznakibacter xylanolyticus TaxID=990 RepID=A0A2W7MXN2_9BACT|nr:hypothetical protein LX69_02837 [Breznakibacter xylanolyticus]